MRGLRGGHAHFPAKKSKMENKPPKKFQSKKFQPNRPKNDWVMVKKMPKYGMRAKFIQYQVYSVISLLHVLCKF